MAGGPLKASSKRVEAALADLGVDCEFRSYDSSARSADEAAASIGCPVGQIAKSLIFREVESDRAVLVVASGSNRVDERVLARLVGGKIARADADFVRRKTGFAIGGVPPLAHSQPSVVFIDRDLLDYDEIWAAAGTPNTVVCLKSAQLEEITAGHIVDVKKT